jgi:hypothetical protein
MKRYIKELIIVVIQMLAFYILPLFAGPTDMMGLIYLLILTTFFLSIALGVLSHNKIKYLYSVIIAILFIPSIFIYYNDSAFIHSVWYLVVSAVGLLMGAGINLIVSKIKKGN